MTATPHWDPTLAKLIHEALLPLALDEDDHMTIVQTITPALLAEGHLIETAVLSAYLGGHTGALFVLPLSTPNWRSASAGLRNQETT